MTANTREQQLLDAMLTEWGYLMGNAGLRKAFGFPNVSALRYAIGKGTLPVRVFTIPGRKGHFALTHDVAASLAAYDQSANTAQSSPSRHPKPKETDTP
jgi:hypothetical protein